MLVVAAKNKRFLDKLSGAATPSRPKAKFEKSDRQRRSGYHSENTNQRLLSANLGPDILAGYRGLQVRRDHLGHVSVSEPTAKNKNSHHNGERDSIIAKDLHAVAL